MTQKPKPTLLPSRERDRNSPLFRNVESLDKFRGECQMFAAGFHAAEIMWRSQNEWEPSNSAAPGLLVSNAQINFVCFSGFASRCALSRGLTCGGTFFLRPKFITRFISFQHQSRPQNESAKTKHRHAQRGELP